MLAAAALAAASSGHAADAPRLQTLVARAPLVVAARVSDVEPLDAGRVAVARLETTAVPKGERPASALRVVETRDMPSVPPSLEKGMLVLAFVEPLHRNSYLTRTLPHGDYRQLMAGRIGRLVAATPAELAEIVAVVERILDTSRTPEPDAALRGAAARTLVFDEIAARSPVLVEDGAGGLQMIPSLAESLSEEERQHLATALGRNDLPPPARAALVRAVGSNGLRQLVPALQSLRSPAAPVLAAKFEALERLGTPPGVADVEPYLASKDAAVRAAAARALPTTPGDEGVARAGQIALADPEVTVRQATIEALGESRRQEALAPLARVFRESPLHLRQIAGRSIFQVGGPAAADTLARLAFDAPAEGQRLAVLLLMALQGGRDDPRVQNIAKTHPDPELRKLIEQGIEPPHQHGVPH